MAAPASTFASPMKESVNRRLVDYSQGGQALVLEQLFTADTPRIVVDIGAHDGISGSNSRALVEQGWFGLLVEPMPSVFSLLQANCAHLQNTKLVQAACSDRNGTARIRLGKDGPEGQLSSLATDPLILENVTNESLEVETITLEELLSRHSIPDDFGVLLVDTEGWDLTVLRGLARMRARPRIIVTEEHPLTNREKYEFLLERKYRFVGTWGSDSLWISESHPADVSSVRMPVMRLTEPWVPSEKHVETGRAVMDENACLRSSIVGWAWTEIDEEPEPEVAVVLDGVDSAQRYSFRAWRMPRSDVSDHFSSGNLLMSGFRAPIDVPAGTYDVTVLQRGNGVCASNSIGRIICRETEIRRVESASTPAFSSPAAVVEKPIRAATVGFFEALSTLGEKWSATGWTIDPATEQPCTSAFVLQGGEIAPDCEFEPIVRPEVNSHLAIEASVPSGISVSFHPNPKGGQIGLVAVLPSGSLVQLPGPGSIVAANNEVFPTRGMVTDTEWQAKCSRRLYPYPSDSAFRGIYSFDPVFDPAHAAGVTDQFLENAAVYHRKYTDHFRWRLLLSHAFIRAGVDQDQQFSVLDVGSGSGNTVLPLLQLLPHGSVVANDISPQLLAMLRDQLNESDRRRTLLISMDAAERNFNPGAFDLSVGAAILHHIIDPSNTIGSCFAALREGGHAIFFEPFEEGYLLLRLLYEELIANRRELSLSDSVVSVFQAIIRDVEVRTGSDKSAPIYQVIDDKWSFTRTYFEQQKQKYGYSRLRIYPLDTSPTQFSSQVRTHLRLCLNAGDEAMAPAAWQYIHAFQRKLSREFASEILMEACVILTK